MPKPHIRRTLQNARQILFHWLMNPALTIHDNCIADQPSGSRQQQQQFELTTTTNKHVAMVQIYDN